MTTTSVEMTLSAPDRWHRPLLAFAIAMLVLAAGAALLSLIDAREVTGAAVWLKPLKFAISGALYTLTLAWLVGQVRRGRRAADRAATWVVIGLSIEILLIFALAAVAQSSHFDITTPLHTAVWAVMAASITLVWVMTLVIAVALLRNPGTDAARTLAARAAVLVALVGLGLGFLMTLPTPDQIGEFEGIVGAHAVGVPDGGPGLPLVGWSTVGGDLRIPHFVGMHALQVIPLALVALELLGRRIGALSVSGVRVRILAVIIAVFVATLATLTTQALAGESIVRPSGATLAAGAAIAVAGAVAITTVLARAPRALRAQNAEEGSHADKTGGLSDRGVTR
jgi:hypothetical protein